MPQLSGFQRSVLYQTTTEIPTYRLQLIHCSYNRFHNPLSLFELEWKNVAKLHPISPTMPKKLENNRCGFPCSS